MSIGIVCTEHKVNLRTFPDVKTDSDSNIAALALVCDFTDEDLNNTEHYHEYTIDITQFYCPKAHTECARWHAAVDLDTGEPLDESFERNIHRNWVQEYN